MTRTVLVKCRLCGAEKKRLAPHLRIGHGMPVAEYARRFPGAAVRVGENAQYGESPGERWSAVADSLEAPR